MRLLVVSNRLPVTVASEGGRLLFKESMGGLTSGLSSYLDSLKNSPSKFNYIWVGWPGSAVPDRFKSEVKSKIFEDYSAYPVFVPEKTMDKFYLGFCNKLIWPLFHYFPSFVVYDEDCWTNYKLVNEKFCNTVLEIIKPGDVVWIHDYHLMLLPALLREKMPEASIGFFLHIPFPSSEIFRIMPSRWRAEILDGLLGADLIGFHTHDYTGHFLSCLLRIKGYKNDMGRVIVNDRIVRADTFPMGIDFKKFYNAARSQEAEKETNEIKKTLKDYKVIISIDRLDYSKGLVGRLEGYELFLKKNPHWHGKVVLVSIVVPSRIGVEKYQQMKKRIDELVGKINGEFGNINWTPVIYQYKYLPFYPLVAVYSVGDVALITPLRDGMNLVAKEYVAVRADKSGVLILSEMAGSAKELGEAVIVNPGDKEEIADAIKRALEMPEEEQMRINSSMQNRIRRYDVTRWAEDFIKELFNVKEEQKKISAKFLDDNTRVKIIKDFKRAKERLLLLDYDGTLVPFAEYPELAKPDEEILNVLEEISKYPQTEVVIISGRDKETLSGWFGGINVSLVAEHGIWIKEKREKDWRAMKPLTNKWKPEVKSILELYSDRLPASFVEEKEFSIAWHYRKADPALSSLRTRELLENMVSLTSNIDVQVLQGDKVIEVMAGGINKGTASLYWISKGKADFIMGMGDDYTDEDMFQSLPEEAYSIKVGLGSTYARFKLHSCIEARKLLKNLMFRS